MFQKRARESVAALKRGTVFLFFTASILSAIGSTNSIARYSVRMWQSDDGLPHNSVWAVAQGAHGYLWVGTQQGLVRFDGLRFVALNDSAPQELRHGWITALCVSRDESLWIGCDGYGLTRMKGGAYSHFGEAEGLPSLHISCLMEARDDSLWIGTEGGVTRFKDGKFATFTDKSGSGANSVRAICQDREGKIRVATSRGLSSINNEENVSTMSFGSGTISNYLKGVCEDLRGNIWVSSNEGVTRDGENGRTFYSQNEGLPDRKATVLYCDRSDRVWVGTYSGLGCLVNGEVVAKPMNQAGFGDLVYTIFEDREENLWVGARDGLYRLTPARFTTYTAQEGLSCNNAMSVMEDRQGAIWIATWGGGLNEMVDGKIRVYGSTNGLTHDSVLSLREGRDGGIWVGMDFDGGLNLLRESRTNAFPKPQTPIGQVIRVIHEDGEGNLWIGTGKVGAGQGLYILRHGKVTNYSTTRGLAGNLVWAICEDSHGEFWIGTDGGLSQWNQGKFVNFTTREGLPNNWVNAVYEDGEHALWIGTKGGLARMKDGKFTSYTSKHGLFSDEIYEILEDDYGNFWMSCRAGIFRVNKKDFEAVDRGLAKTVACTVFGKADGLVSVQCNGVAKPAGWKSKDGRLWFPTIRGMVAVDSRIKMNDKPPPVIIEEVIADRNVQKFIGGAGAENSEALATINIPPGRGELEIHYTALSLQAPEKNRFQYMLMGVDQNWIDAGTRHEAFYNNLGPGSYRFHVRACNNDGVWNESGIVLPIVLAPHFWQMLWFKLAIPAVVGLLLFAWYRFRMAQLREIERLRVQIAADLHDDVGARLTKVAMVTEFMERETGPMDKSKPHVENIARTTREVIQAMDEIVWTINPKNDTLDNLANYIFQYAQEYFQNTGVRCRMDLPA